MKEAMRTRGGSGCASVGTAAAAASRMPWTGEQAALASDLARDGHTLASIARRLNRSKYGVGSQLRKMGIRVSQARKTRELVVCVAKTALEQLEQPAAQRCMSVNRFAALVLEIAAREPGWLDRLLEDDASAQRNDALLLQPDPDPRPSAASPVAVNAPATADTLSAVPSFVIALAGMQPQLTGVMAPH